MRRALASLACCAIFGLGWSPLHAQRALEREPEKETKKAAKSEQQQRRQQGARERTQSDGAPDHKGHRVGRDSRPPTGQPSPAEQQQRRLHEERAAGERRTVRCSAQPVCTRAGYAGCRGVEQVYPAASLASSQRDIVRQCVQANTPDSCDCASQCALVAQCSNF